MELSLKVPETDRRACQVAKRAGHSLTEAMGGSLRSCCLTNSRDAESGRSTSQRST